MNGVKAMNEAMNELKVFQNDQFGEIRTVVKDGGPWFVAADVCRALEISNPTVAIDRLDEDERAKFNLGRQGETNIVNEPGLYSLVLGSRKPEARAFKRWITHDVIPAIRKTGSYSVQLTAAEQLLAQAQALVEQEKRVSAVEDKVNRLEAKVTTRPEVDDYTIAGYASLRGINVDVNTARMLGQRAAILSRAYGYDIGRVSDPRFGKVNTYHVDILKTVFQEAGVRNLSIGGVC